MWAVVLEAAVEREQVLLLRMEQTVTNARSTEGIVWRGKRNFRATSG